MRKGLIVLLAAVMVAAFSLPAMADMSTSGFMRIKAHVEQNYGGGPNGFILPAKDPPTAHFVEQRQRFILDYNTENVGARFYFEIDFSRWGDAAYQSGLRNGGAALEADTINLETKNVYIWFNVPNTSLKVQAGLQNQSDSYDGVIFGVADMAGIFLTGKMEPVSYKLGWAKWQDKVSTLDDAVDLYVAEVKFAPTKEAKLGVNLYMLRDASGESSPVAGNINLSSIVNRIGPQYGFTVTSFTYQPSAFYYVGLDGSIQAGPVALSGWAFYNFGKLEKVNAAGTLFSTPLVNEDLDVKGWAAALRGDLNLGPGKFFLGVGYVSGSGENDTDYKGIITGENYATAGSYPFYKWDMQILFPNGDDLTDSAALAYGVGNNGRGILGAAAGYSQKFSDMLSGKVGLGYLSDAKNPLGSNAGGISISKHKAFEVNANVNYAMIKGLDLGLYGAYAFLTDWESYSGQVAQVSGTSFIDADDIFKVYARLNYSF